MKKKLLNSEYYQQAFEQVTQLLQNFSAIWRHKPFVEDSLPWQTLEQYDALYQALLSLTDEQVAQFEQEPRLIDWLGQYIPDLLAGSAWQLPDSPYPPIAVAKFADVGMPGRKKQQIEHFVGAFAPFYRRFDGMNRGIADWCCGKGHLATHLHQQLGGYTLGLEYDEQLVNAGRANVRVNAGLVYQCVDVLKPLDLTLFDEIGWHSGLHACGDLHVQLLKQAVTLGHGAVIAPCCYHLIQTDDYQPLSVAANNADLKLSKDDLRLAVLQTVTSGRRVKRLRQTELLWRTAFDLWYRDTLKIDKYTHFSSVSKHWFSGSFVDFCAHLAQSCDTVLPADFDSEHYLALAAQKMARVKRLEFARLGFRYVLELWLLLDRVLYLQEQGFEVDLLRFCEGQLTPRNGMIIARPK